MLDKKAGKPGIRHATWTRYLKAIAEGSVAVKQTSRSSAGLDPFVEGRQPVDALLQHLCAGFSLLNT